MRHLSGAVTAPLHTETLYRAVIITGGAPRSFKAWPRPRVTIAAVSG
jgi:hypothetical protein